MRKRGDEGERERDKLSIKYFKGDIHGFIFKISTFKNASALLVIGKDKGLSLGKTSQHLLALAGFRLCG